ncbi:MAG TPA: tetratricopeptide repeat protein, partial [Thermoanaerobaculia bacterium]
MMPEQIPPHEAEERSSGLERIWARLTARGVRLEAERAAEQEQARPLFAELMAQPEDRRLETIAGDSRYWTLAVVDRLLQATERASAAAVRAQTELALAILERLDTRRYGASTASGRQAVAWCHQADARRREGDSEAAAAGVRRAAGHLAGELLDAWERAVYCRRLAALRRDQERDDEALGLLRRAVELCREWGEMLLAAESLCDMADLWLAAGDPETALHRFQEAREDAETPAAVPYVAIRVQHGLARCHAQLGERAKAGRLLRDVQPLYRLLSPVERLRCLRVEARIHDENGHASRAQSLLRPLVAHLIDEGAFLDAALAALDLAQIAAERGQVGEVRRLADRMAPRLAAGRLPDPAA